MRQVCKAGLGAFALLLALTASQAAAAVVYRSVGDLTAEAQQIIIGDVTAVTSFWDASHELIKTHVIVSVDQYLVGTGTGTEVLEMDGGTVGDEGLRVSTLPVFETGDRVLLFLRSSVSSRIGSFQAAYLTDGKQVARMRPLCGRLIDSSVQPLSDVVQEIRGAVPPGTVVPDARPYTGGFRLPLGESRYELCGFDWTQYANPMGESYRINANCTDASAGDSASQIAQIQNGFNTWTSAGADFAFTYGGTSTSTSVSNNGTNLIFFHQNPPVGSDVIAYNQPWTSGGHMTESDIAFNDRDFVWWNGSGSCSGMMDIQDIITHELGHTLCLLDLYNGYDSEKTMYGYSSSCETNKRTLASDDISGIIAIYGSGTDTQPPQPNPMTFATAPHALSETSIAMAATPGTDLTPPVYYYFWASNGNNRDWATDYSYTDNSALANTLQSYKVQARDSCVPAHTGDFSTEESVTTAIETPQGVSFGTVTSSSIVLNVVGPLTNLTVGTSGAYFNSTTSGGNTGISEWIQVTTDTATALSPNTQYTFRARARNQLNIATAYSPTSSKYTLANVPSAPTLGGVTSDSMTLDVNANGNPAATLFAIQCVAPADAAWNNKYVDATGHASASAVWQTDATWGTITVQGLLASTQYCFKVKARNADLIETAFSAQSCQQTQASPTNCPGDSNCDNAINWRDIDYFVAAMSGEQSWLNMFPVTPTCQYTNNDVNGDGAVNWRDIDPFVALMGTACP